MERHQIKPKIITPEQQWYENQIKNLEMEIQIAKYRLEIIPKELKLLKKKLERFK